MKSSGKLRKSLENFQKVQKHPKGSENFRMIQENSGNLQEIYGFLRI